MLLKNISTRCARQACVDTALIIDKSTRATQQKEAERIQRLTTFLADLLDACTRRDQTNAKREKRTPKRPQGMIQP